MLVAGAATAREAVGIRGQLTSARDTLQQAIDNPAALATAPGRAATLSAVDAAVRSTADARRRAGGGAVSLFGRIPGLRRQWRGLIDLVDDSSAAATAARTLLAQVDSLAQENQLSGGQVPLEPMQVLRGQVEAAARTLGALVHPRGGLWGPLGQARHRFDRAARSGSRRLARAADALGAARSFMGVGGDRRYLVVLENNAEMRDQGMVLQYARARFQGGKLTFAGNGSVADLALDRPAPTPVPPGSDEVFGSISPTRLWQSVNATADFAWSGRAMADMYHQATGDSVDGVIGIDVPGLADLLGVIGPVRVPGIGEILTPRNAGRVLLHDLYEGAPNGDQGSRRERLGELTRAVIERLTTASHDPVALGRALGVAARGGHLRLWSTVIDEERVFEQSALGGGPGATDADRTFHVAVENRTATKLDYYVKPSVRQEMQLSPQGTLVVRTTVVVDNQAPVGQSPSYQLGPDGVATTNPGDYLAWLLLWGPAGATQPGAVPESGLVLSQRVVPVAAGQRREATFETVVPDAVRDGRLRLRLVPQARLVPVDLDVRLRAPGWHVSGPRSWRGAWDRTLALEWGVSH